METYFYIDHARRICVIGYLNLRTEAQMCRTLRDFWEKKNSCGLHRHRSVRPVLLCEEHRYVFMIFFFHEFDEMA